VSLPRRLIVNADDFGASSAINAAVRQAHQEGILTSASLMVGGAAWEEAVAIARAHPRLGVGLHLTLVCGRPVLPPGQIPGLLGPDATRLDDRPVRAGLRWFFRPGLRAQLEAEIRAQFERFAATGLRLDHVNGHLNTHLHPVVLDILLAQARAWGIRHLRLTRDPFRLNARLAGGAWGYRLTHALIFHALCARARPRLRRAGIGCTARVFGLLQNGRVDEGYVRRLLARLPAGDSELYCHPGTENFQHELAALVSPRVRDGIAAAGIELVRYQDLQP
jgi:hopanoid biosynthesis associated protein HpnK